MEDNKTISYILALLSLFSLGFCCHYMFFYLDDSMMRIIPGISRAEGAFEHLIMDCAKYFKGGGLWSFIKTLGIYTAYGAMCLIPLVIYGAMFAQSKKGVRIVACIVICLVLIMSFNVTTILFGDHFATNKPTVETYHIKYLVYLNPLKYLLLLSLIGNIVQATLLIFAPKKVYFLN